MSLLGLLIAIGGGITYTRDIQAERNAVVAEKAKANDRERDALRSLYVARSALAQVAWRENEVGRMRGLVDACGRDPVSRNSAGSSGIT